MKLKIKAAMLALCLTIGMYSPLATAAETVKTNVRYGDLDADGIVNAADAVTILQAAALFGTMGSYGLDSRQVIAADVNQDKVINSKDAWEVLHYSAHAGVSPEHMEFLEYLQMRNVIAVPSETSPLVEEPLTEPDTDPVEYYFDPTEEIFDDEPIENPIEEPIETNVSPIIIPSDPTEQITPVIPTEQPVPIVPVEPTTEFHFEIPPIPAGDTVEGVFLGVRDWGASGTTFANASRFRYRFNVGGTEQLYTVSNLPEGDMDFPIQNQLKVNYRFRLTLNGNEIIDVQELENGLPSYTPPVSGTPGVLTVRNFLATAMEPVGTTLYMFGGGWNWQDGKYANGSEAEAVAGWQTRKIGVQPDWVRFFAEHDGSYTYRTNNKTTTYYPYGEFNQYYYAGLDCSGYVGWTLYNTLETQDGNPGYVTKSTYMAKRLANRGWGTWSHSVNTSTRLRPGDIMSISGHVWLSLGTCSDGSIVIAHSTPSDSFSGQPGGGVQIGAVGNSTNCQAYQLASRYMNMFYPEWCSRYKVTLKSKSDYLSVSGNSACGSFSWNGTYPLSDPEGIQNMSADQALYMIFGV